MIALGAVELPPDPRKAMCHLGYLQITGRVDYISGCRAAGHEIAVNLAYQEAFQDHKVLF